MACLAAPYRADIGRAQESAGGSSSGYQPSSPEIPRRQLDAPSYIFFDKVRAEDANSDDSQRIPGGRREITNYARTDRRVATGGIWKGERLLNSEWVQGHGGGNGSGV